MIELTEVAYSYGDGALLAGVTLTLAPGSFHLLTGRSGSGKSTLIRLCHMELLPSSGNLTVFGQDVRQMDRDAVALARRRIGIVNQESRFLDHLPLTENLALPRLIADRDAGSEEQDLRELMAWVGLSERADALPTELSGGERQRAGLARAVIMDPEIVLADEPTGNVDWEMSLRLMQLLIDLNRVGKTILVATHDHNLIRAVTEGIPANVLRIEHGTLTHAGEDL